MTLTLALECHLLVKPWYYQMIDSFLIPYIWQNKMPATMGQYLRYFLELWKLYLRTSHKTESVPWIPSLLSRTPGSQPRALLTSIHFHSRGQLASVSLKKNGHFKVWTLIGSRSWESKGISQKGHFRNNLDCFESHGELLILSGVKTVSSDCDQSSLLLRNACEVFKGEVLWGLQFPSAQFRKKKNTARSKFDRMLPLLELSDRYMGVHCTFKVSVQLMSWPD